MITKLTLPNGEWIDVKDKQTVRNEREVYSYSNEGVTADSSKYNIVKHRIATAAVRILRWSVTNDEGKVIAWPAGASFKERVDVIESLYEEQLDAISAAITAHLTALAKDQAAEKNETQDGATDSGQSSPSAS